MTVSTPTHRTLVDAETLIERAHVVALISEGLRISEAWKQDGDLVRRRVAKRLAFQRWRRVGEPR